MYLNESTCPYCKQKNCARLSKEEEELYFKSFGAKRPDKARIYECHNCLGKDEYGKPDTFKRFRFFGSF